LAVCGLPAVNPHNSNYHESYPVRKEVKLLLQDMALPDSKGAEKHSAGMASELERPKGWQSAMTISRPKRTAYIIIFMDLNIFYSNMI